MDHQFQMETVVCFRLEFRACARYEVVELWKSAKEKTGLNITPQKLRHWFCSEMLRLGVSETYVDAFRGRVPKSVLSRHYTDFSPEKLREAYLEANLDIHLAA
jgi:integrase